MVGFHFHKGEVSSTYGKLFQGFLRGHKDGKQWPVPVQNICSNYTSLKYLVGILGRGNSPTQGPALNPYVTNVIYIYIYIYIYINGAPILDVSRSHTTTHHSR